MCIYVLLYLYFEFIILIFFYSFGFEEFYILYSMHANQPHNIRTHQGTFSLETDIVDSNRANREIPIVDVKASILPGPVKDPQVLFGSALRECYGLATRFMHVQPCLLYTSPSPRD